MLIFVVTDLGTKLCEDKVMGLTEQGWGAAVKWMGKASVLGARSAAFTPLRLQIAPGRRTALEPAESSNVQAA